MSVYLNEYGIMLATLDFAHSVLLHMMNTLVLVHHTKQFFLPPGSRQETHIPEVIIVWSGTISRRQNNRVALGYICSLVKKAIAAMEISCLSPISLYVYSMKLGVNTENSNRQANLMLCVYCHLCL